VDLLIFISSNPNEKTGELTNILVNEVIEMLHKLPVLIIASEKYRDESVSDLAMKRLEEAIHSQGYETMMTTTPEDGLAQIVSYPGFGCIILDWDLPGGEHVSEHVAEDIIRAIRARDKKIPIFLIAEKTMVNDLPIEVVEEVHEYVYMYQDTAAFIAGRVDFAIRRYYDLLLPPYFAELKRFTEDAPYSWDAPGHMGGVAYLKHPIGMEFHKFFGENIMRADIGISTAELGDWLEHIGPPLESERNAARIFGAKWTFYVLGGSSASNRIVCQGAIGAEEMVIADRNCHKSLNHGLTISRARPVYLKPTRNGYGMIGLIPPACFKPAYISDLIEKSPLNAGAVSKEPSYAVVTNCTYDGFCYDVDRIVKLLAKSVPRVHFDEAWYAYAKFHPLYQGRFAMGVPYDLDVNGVPKDRDLPTLFAVQSTHKMLPAFSMASMIHVKVNPKRADLEFDQFNEAFMMHGTTSPFYPMIASIDVATSMMDEPGGPTMMHETVLDAIGLRKAIAWVAKQYDWFFGCYQPDRVNVINPATGEPYDFEDAPDELLASDPSCWTLKLGDAWHGFEGDVVSDGYCMLDPTKVTILCPGVDPQGRISEWGIPGAILTRFLDSRRIEIARTGDYTVLVLFSVGSSKGKWGTLLEALIEFNRLYDGDATISEVLPELTAEFPESYSSNPDGTPMTLKDLCQKMHTKMVDLELPNLLHKACDFIPDAVFSPAETYQKLVRYQTKSVKVSEAADRISGHMLVPYPPGIPILMPGERLGDPHIQLLLKLQDFSQYFPGFEHEIHGIDVDNEGTFWMRCVIEHEEKASTAPFSELKARPRSVMKSFKKGRW